MLVPRVAVAVAENDTVTVQVGVHGLFVKVAVTPEERDEAENATCADVPLTRVVTIDEVGLVAPWTTVRLAGDGVERLKPKGARVTVSDSVVE